MQQTVSLITLGVADYEQGKSFYGALALEIDEAVSRNHADPSWAGIVHPYVVGYELAG